MNYEQDDKRIYMLRAFNSPILSSEYADVAFDKKKFDLASRMRLNYHINGKTIEYHTIKDMSDYHNPVLYNVELSWPHELGEIVLTFELEDNPTYGEVQLIIDTKRRKCVLIRLDIDKNIIPNKILHNGLYFVIKSIYLRILEHNLSSDAYEYSLEQYK
jgi:hypothetical protein